jgi:exosome complex exonuclease RRP6
VAREEDESVRYVLPDKMLFNIAKIIPVDTNQLLICCTPTPPLLRVHANDVVLLIQDALENNVNLGPSKK